ncbi:MAG: PEP-CTERM sorting domain-containing protein [Phycisphaeraceae bacterium]|nr:PEP-CTERM sorting domain-containing protein [Phycisphaeraceae bacterium]
MRLLAKVSLVGVVFLSLVSPALADDLNPPEWRGQDRTTMQEWQFLTDNPQPLADLVVNPYGVPSAQVWPGTGQSWWQEWGGREGVWPLSGAIELYIPNASPNEYKDIWIQLTWAKQAFMSAPVLSTIPGGTIEVIQQIDIGPTGEALPAGPNWWHTTYNVRIYPNPTFETIRIDGTIMVDQIVVDTICVPEPTALGLLTIGGLALLRRRHVA